MQVSIHCKKIVREIDGQQVTLTPTPPKRGTSLAAGMDLQCLEKVTIPAGKKVIIETGLIVKPPRGFCTLILPRSGLAAKKELVVLNSPGLIDRDYCGPNDTIKVICKNHGEEDIEFEAGDRVAQLMVIPYAVVDWQVEDNPNFAQGDDRGGLGSTGNS